MKTVVINPQQLLFGGSNFHCVFFVALFTAVFEALSPRLSPGPCLKIGVPGNFHSCHNKVSMSNEVGQYEMTLKSMPSWRRGRHA